MTKSYLCWLLLLLCCLFTCKVEDDCVYYEPIPTQLVFLDRNSQEDISLAIQDSIIIHLLSGVNRVKDPAGFSFLIDRVYMEGGALWAILNRNYNAHLVTYNDRVVDTLWLEFETILDCNASLQNEIKSIRSSNGNAIETSGNQFSIKFRL